jgi:hypothetical protein
MDTAERRQQWRVTAVGVPGREQEPELATEEYFPTEAEAIEFAQTLLDPEREVWIDSPGDRFGTGRRVKRRLLEDGSLR